MSLSVPLESEGLRISVGRTLPETTILPQFGTATVLKPPMWTDSIRYSTPHRKVGVERGRHGRGVSYNKYLLPGVRQHGTFRAPPLPRCLLRPSSTLHPKVDCWGVTYTGHLDANTGNPTTLSVTHWPLRYKTANLSADGGMSPIQCSQAYVP